MIPLKTVTLKFLYLPVCASAFLNTVRTGKARKTSIYIFLCNGKLYSRQLYCYKLNDDTIAKEFLYINTVTGENIFCVGLRLVSGHEFKWLEKTVRNFTQE